MKISQIEKYTFSGRLSIKAAGRVLTLGTCGAALVAALYAVVIHYNPLIYFSFLATLLFGGLVGIIAAGAARSGNSRSVAFNTAAAVMLSLFALWFHWIIWAGLVFGDSRETMTLLLRSGPAAWMDFFTFAANNVQAVYFVHAHKVGSSPGWLSTLWSLEAAAVVFCAVIGARLAPDHAFNEKSGNWTETEGVLELALGDVGVDAARDMTLWSTLDLPLQGAVDAALHASWNGLKIQLERDVADTQFCIVNIAHIAYVVKPKGKVGKTTTALIELGKLPLAEYEQLKQRLSAQPADAAALATG